MDEDDEEVEGLPSTWPAAVPSWPAAAGQATTSSASMSRARTEGNFSEAFGGSSLPFVQVLGKETEESASFELDLSSLRQVKHLLASGENREQLKATQALVIIDCWSKSICTGWPAKPFSHVDC